MNNEEQEADKYSSIVEKAQEEDTESTNNLLNEIND